MTPSELQHVLATATRLTAQIPANQLDDKLPNRNRSLLALANHIVEIAAGYLLVEAGRAIDREVAGAIPASELDRDALARRSASVEARLAAAEADLTKGQRRNVLRDNLPTSRGGAMHVARGATRAAAGLYAGKARNRSGSALGGRGSRRIAAACRCLGLVVEHTCNDVSVVAGVFLARRGREVVPGYVERAQRGEGRTGDHPKGAPTNAHLLCCRLSTYARYAFEATPRIWSALSARLVDALTRHYKCVRPLAFLRTCHLYS